MNKELVVASGLKQSEIADLIGISRVMVNRYLNGKSTPTIKPIIHRIAKLENFISKNLAEHRLPLDTDKGVRAELISNIKEQLI